MIWRIAFIVVFIAAGALAVLAGLSIAYCIYQSGQSFWEFVKENYEAIFKKGK